MLHDPQPPTRFQDPGKFGKNLFRDSVTNPAMGIAKGQDQINRVLAAELA